MCAALTGQKPKQPKPPNKGALAGNKGAAGASKGRKAGNVTNDTAKSTAKRKPTAQPTSGGVTAPGTAPKTKAMPAPGIAQKAVSKTSDLRMMPGADNAPATAGALPISGNIPGGTEDPVTALNKADAPTKRRKVSDISVEESTTKVKAAIAAGTLTKLSVPELKVYLKSIGKPVGGKKSDLLQRIQPSHEP